MSERSKQETGSGRRLCETRDDERFCTKLEETHMYKRRDTNNYTYHDGTNDSDYGAFVNGCDFDNDDDHDNKIKSRKQRLKRERDGSNISEYDYMQITSERQE